MRHQLLFLTFLFAVSCGPPASMTGKATFALVLADEPIEVAAQERTLVQIVTIGADGAPVTISATSLPGFAALSGSVLVLTPVLSDAGAHEIALTAQAGMSTASAVLRLTVTRTNTAPRLRSGPGLGGAAPVRSQVSLCDGEGDNVLLDFEILPAPNPTFAGAPTHGFDVIWSDLEPGVSHNGTEKCAQVSFAFPLAAGTYSFKMRMTDALGATTHDPFGWVRYQDFTVTQ